MLKSTIWLYIFPRIIITRAELKYQYRAVMQGAFYASGTQRIVFSLMVSKLWCMEFPLYVYGRFRFFH
jgi:hypothetical protein